MLTRPEEQSSGQSAPSAAASDSIAMPRCSACANPARVSVLKGYDEGAPVRVEYCSACADALYSPHRERVARGKSKLNLSTIILIMGALLVSVGVFADDFGHQGSDGFGPYQVAAVVLGCLVVVLGALLRIDLLVVPGVVLAALGALADVFGRVGTPGFGWRQQIAVVAGVILVAVALARRGGWLPSATGDNRDHTATPPMA